MKSLSTLKSKRSKLSAAVASTFLLTQAATVNAELKALSDDSMSEVTGRAGLTIDIETQMTIGELQYMDSEQGTDGASWFYKDITLNGIGGGLVDNLRAVIDISNTSETLATGFSDYAMLASYGFLDATETDVAWALAEYDDGNGSFGKQYGDGDAVIHVTSQDLGIGLDAFSAPDPADHANNLTAIKDAVDLHLQHGEFGIRASDGSVETTLTRSFSAEAYLGYFDILITNRGNGFTQTSDTDGKPNNVLLADSYIGLDLKFRVDDLDIDNTSNALNTVISRDVTSPNLVIKDMQIHNQRGGDTLGSFGFASFESKIGAAQKRVE